MKDEILINTQLALFLDRLIDRPEDRYQRLNEALGGIMDGNLIALPIPIELSDIPVVQLSSKDGIYGCNIARGRIDLFVAGEGRQPFEAKMKTITELSEKLIAFCGAESLPIKRVGFVSRFFIPEQSQDKVIEQAIVPGFRDLFGIESESAFVEVFVRYVRSVKFDEFDFNVNNFVTLERMSARLSGEPSEVAGIQITRDFNSNPTENLSSKFSNFSIRKFIEQSKESFKLKEIEKTLWPTLE
ncbi:MAG: hypothetical protein WC813_03455 [Patescibacteria group bacterium]|jgi:hypothetical protein